MGKRGGKRGQRPNKKPRSGGAYNELVLHSDKFIDYYKNVGLFSEDEWDAFMTKMKSPLPTTFRITKGTIFAEEIRQYMDDFVKSQPEKIVLPDGKEIDPPKPISWYPGNNAWYFQAGKTDLRKLPQFKPFHRFLVHQTENGNVSRQEAVSMLPPLFLQVEPHHKVIDLCASPGSKTQQIIESLHRDDFSAIPTGFVVANDLSLERCYVLIHQVKRQASPTVVVVSHEAQFFPLLKNFPPPGEDPSVCEGFLADGKVNFSFDRILCDVPCSGDGTLRKTPDAWTKWSTGMALGLHRLQLSIAMRAVKILKVGGRLVYSTCSMSPVENEAVVAELLRRSKGSMRLVDCHDMMPSLLRRPGIVHWKVQDKDVWYESHKDITNPKRQRIVAPSVFPPSKDELDTLHLERCMRFFPHMQDTGGFFVAVLEKTSAIFGPMTQQQKEEFLSNDAMETEKEEIKEEEGTEKEDKEEVEEEDKGVTNPGKKEGKVTLSEIRNRKRLEDPFLFALEQMKPVIEQIKEFFGLREDFPFDQLMCRSEKSPKLYLMSPGVKGLLEADARQQLQLINTGVKVFQKHDARQPYRCPYRVSQEGVRFISPYITKRKLTITEGDFFNLLENKNPLIHSFSAGAQEQLKEMEEGAVIAVLNNDCQNKSWAGTVWSAWRGKASVLLLLPKEELNALTHLGKKYDKSQDMTLVPEQEIKEESAVEPEKSPEETRANQ